MLVEKSRAELSVGVDEFIRISQEDSNLRIIDVTAGIAVHSQQLPGDLHRDPADRLIVSSARLCDATLATVDEKLVSYPHVRMLDAKA